MSSYQEIESTAHEIRRRNLPLAMLQCTSRYPTPLHEVGLNVVSELRRRFDCPVGLSDHSGSVFPGAVAMARGADLLEVHVVFDRRLFGPDTPASVTIEELKFLADTRSACAVMDQHPVDKDAMAGEMSAMRELFTKSLAPARCLTAGTVITEDMLVAKKPGSGIPSSEKNIILGRRLARDVRPDRLLSWEDIHEE